MHSGIVYFLGENTGLNFPRNYYFQPDLKLYNNFLHIYIFFESVERTPFCLLASASVLLENYLHSLDRASAMREAKSE